VEDTWIAKKDLGGRAIRLIPRMRETIEKWNPGMGLAITEYNYGGENHISGAIAQADILGIFGREGVFAANYWPLAPKSTYIYGAFKMFRNFDGKRSRFGDTALASTTSSPTRTSVYGSIDPINPKQLVLVVLNKTKDPLTVDLSVKGTAETYKSAEIYKLNKDSPLPGLFTKTSFSDLKNLTIPGFTIYTIKITP
jgi:mannan endo-1,4-beta-mannosidase